MNLNSRPSSWIFKRIASLLGALVLSTVLLPTAPAMADFSTWTARATVQDWQGVASSSDGTKLVATTRPGLIYTSADSGVTWTPRATIQYWSQVASSSDGTKLVAVGWGGYIYTSTDSGVTWTPRATVQYWWGVASSSDGTKLVAGVTSGQIYTSVDSGVTWTLRTTLTANLFGIASSSDGTKLAAVASGASGAQIYTSSDSGVTWTLRFALGSWSLNNVASSSDGTKLIAAANGGYIYTSTDSGVTWTPRATVQYWSTVASSGDGTKLVAANYSNGHIYTSTDSGVTWTPQATVQFWSGVASSSDGTKLVATTHGGYIYTSVMSVPSYMAPTPIFSTPVSTATGFTVNVTNYDPAFTFTPTTSAGRVVVGKTHEHTLSLSVTGLTPGASATLTVTTARNGYSTSYGAVTGTALFAALIPTFSTSISTATGFTVNVTNYNPAFIFTATTSPRESAAHVVVGVASGATLPLTVLLTQRSRVTVTVTTTRTGYATGKASVTGIIGAKAALIPTFSTPVSTATGFTVNVTNYNPAFTFTPTTSAGRVVVGKKHEHTLRLSITHLSPGASATLTVTTTRKGYNTGNGAVAGTALFAALIPTFSTPVSTATGFTVNVTNYNPAYAFTATTNPKTSATHVVIGVASGATLPLTVLTTSKSRITITVTTTRTGYATGKASVTARAL